MNDLSAIKRILSDGEYTCVLSNGEDLVTSRERGVKPLVRFIESGDYKGYIAADKIVGKAAALLYACMGISRLYASVISTAAVEVCRRFNIEVVFDTLTERIINRKGDDICPIEKLVADIDEPLKAKEVICRKLKNL